MYPASTAAAANTNEAAIQTAQGQAASQAAQTKAIGTLLTGTGQFASTTNWFGSDSPPKPGST